MAAPSSSKAKLGSTGGPTTQTTSWTRIFKTILHEKPLAWQATSSHQDEIQVIEDTIEVINDENVDDFPLLDDLNDVSKLFFTLPLKTYFVYSACTPGSSITQALWTLQKKSDSGKKIVAAKRRSKKRAQKKNCTFCAMSLPSYTQIALRRKLKSSAMMPRKGLPPR